MPPSACILSRQHGGKNFPDRLTLSYRKASEPALRREPAPEGRVLCLGRQVRGPAWAPRRLLGGKEISYNNYFDANGALELVKDFADPAIAIIKHANPAGCAIDSDLVEAYRKAYFGDVNAAMGGIIAVNRPVTAELAKAIVETYSRWGKKLGAGGFYRRDRHRPLYR